MLHLLHEPLAAEPGAGGGHVLAGGVARLVDELDVDLVAHQGGLDADEVGVSRDLADLGADVFDVVADPAREAEGAVHIREHEQRHAHHALLDDARGHAACARDRGGAAGGRGHQGALAGGHGQVQDAARLVASKEQGASQAQRDLDGAKEVLDVAGELLGDEASVLGVLELVAGVFA